MPHFYPVDPNIVAFFETNSDLEGERLGISMPPTDELRGCFTEEIARTLLKAGAAGLPRLADG